MEVSVIGYFVPQVTYTIDSNTVCCKLFKFIVYVFPQLSAWFIFAVTCERTIAVLIPHKVKFWFTKRRTYILIGLVTALVFAGNAHIFWTSYLVYQSGRSFCWEHGGRIHAIVNLSLTYLVPCVLIFLGNMLIVWRVAAAARNRRKMTTDNTDSQVKNILYN